MAKKKKQYKIGILGAGSWGITLGNLLFEKGNKVTLWEFNPGQAEILNEKRKFVSLGDYRIPKGISITSSLKKAVDKADFIVVAVPSVALQPVVTKLAKIELQPSVIVISAVKGFEQKSLLRPSQLLRKYLGNRSKIAVLSGPSHAEEVVNKVPTAVVVASTSGKTRKSVQELFSSLYFRVYTSLDIKGVELGGALKNVIAIASGIASGLGMGDNTRAALITRGNAEMTRLGVKLGAKRATFSGLSGIGDLIVTCFSEHSRNFRFGRYIGKGFNFEQALKKIETTVEGINTARSCYRLSRMHKVQMPVCMEVYRILFKKKPADQAWKELMLRPLKSEDVEF